MNEGGELFQDLNSYVGGGKVVNLCENWVNYLRFSTALWGEGRSGVI